MSLALYRKYRPSVFADVIGQEHVTVPLSNALESGRTHHAYLFSGPRGCGKTSSARIMARSLNCEKGPTPNPCGECQSCKDLVANGPGSLDVIELDAATHGLVDDARLVFMYLCKPTCVQAAVPSNPDHYQDQTPCAMSEQLFQASVLQRQPKFESCSLKSFQCLLCCQPKL